MKQELIEEYIQSLGKRLERINSLLDKLVSGNTNAEDNIRLLAHSLAGSGGSFGFPEISEAGKAAELEKMDALEEKLRALKAVVEKVLEEHGGGTGATNTGATNTVATKENSENSTNKTSQSSVNQNSEQEKAEQKISKAKRDRADENQKVIRVLVVDDDDEIASIVINTLKDLPKKQNITVATTGAKAQELFVKEAFDLIIMDLMLPDKDGRELITEIKLEFKLTTPVLVLSSISNDSVRVECMSLGADKFLLKPFSEEDLLRESKKLLGKKVSKKLTLVPMDGEAVEEEDEDEEDEESPKVLEGFSILIAEDDKMQARLIEQRLNQEGASVTIVQNGREAMQMLRTSEFALVILDIKMPIMDGFEVLQRIKDDLNLETPVIMVTAMGDEADIIRGYDLGAIDYLLKPFSEVQLVARVKSLLIRRIA